MSDLTDFLLARVAEDEATARAATPGPWHSGDRGGWVVSAAYGSPADGDTVAGSDTLQDADHIARHDPARVLAECEARRRIVTKARGTWTEAAFSPSQRLARDAMADVLELLALPYTDHPDYNEEWKP